MICCYNDPLCGKKIKFIAAYKDKKGHIRQKYLLQQAVKMPHDYPFFYVPFGGYSNMDKALEDATAKFESDKAHYLETGELPKDY